MRRCLLLALLALNACASLPPRIATRQMHQGVDPTGTWALDSGLTMAVNQPKENGAQMWDVQFSDGTMGKALSDGEWLYVMSPVFPGDKIGLFVYERTAEGLDGMWGRYKLGWESAKRKGAGTGYAGAYAVEGINPQNKSYSTSMEIKAAEGAPEVFDLLWTTGDTGRFEGIGVETNGKLTALRWGLKVTSSGVKSGSDGSVTFTSSTETRERPHVVLGTYHLTGGRLEGRTVNGDTRQIAPQAWTRK